MRNHMVAILTVLAVSLPAAAFAQFEGVVVMAMGDGARAQDVTQSIKGTRMRMDMQAQAAGGISTIMDTKDGSMTSLMHAQKMYMTMNTKALAQQLQASGMGQSQASGTQAPPPKITKTGKTETIAGRTCEHYVMDTDREALDMCIAKGMGGFGWGGGGGGPLGMGRGGMPQLPQGYEQLAAEFKDGGFPLKMERVSGTTRTVMMLVKSIEAKPLDAALFEVPPGYTEFKMPQMPPRQ